MSNKELEIVDAALNLPESKRAALAGALIKSLDAGQDSHAERLWTAEIQKRVDDLKSGAVKAVPWSEARKQILSDD